VVDKGFGPCKKTISTRTLLYKDPLVQVIFVQQGVIPEIRAFISRRVGRVREKNQHVTPPMTTQVRRLPLTTRN
jgi:hypothetical protein